MICFDEFDMDDLDQIQGNDTIYYHTDNLQDSELMSALSEILKRSTVLAVTQLLESH